MERKVERPVGAAVVMLALLSLLWALEFVDQLTGGQLDNYGIHARELDGLPAIFSAPFLHGGWSHLVSNSLPFFVLGTLVLIGGLARWVVSSLTSIVSSGLAAWALTPANTIVLGASGLILGWLTYVIVSGFLAGKPKQVLIALVVLFFYGGMIWGVLPTSAGISWQAHLGGAVGGVLAAWWLRPTKARVRRTDVTRSRP